jgi:O-antigen/teichoic acid export membrane protein
MNGGIQMRQETYSKSKRIASNTILLFVRMFILTIINLYAVRLVLRGLGEVDYGIYNAIGGVITISSIICSVLALAIQRFSSIAIGEHDEKKLNEIFSVSINITIISAFLILLVFETVGIWFVNTQMTIPANRMAAADWVFQFTLFTFICSIIQIPYTASIFSHEDMGIYAIVSTIECLGRLLIAFLLKLIIIDNLIFYGFGLLLVAVFVLIMYVVIGQYRYKECHYHKTKNITLYKQLLSFSGWSTFGSVANTAMIQGGTILINIFYGPLANVAFGIALQINNAFSALTNSMTFSFRPAMIKAYAEKNYNYVNQLFAISNKFILYVLLAVAIPIIAEMRTILNIWLGSVNDNTLLFSQFMIVYMICTAMHNPITIIIYASGHVKGYHLPVESITLMCLPLTWLLFRIGLPSYSIFYSMIGVCLIAHFVRLRCLHHYYDNFSILQYFTSLIIPAIAIITLGTMTTYFLHYNIENTIWRFIAVGTLSPLTIFLLAFFIGMNVQERQIFKGFIMSYIKNHSCHR